MGILWIGFQWLQTIKLTAHGLVNTEKRLDEDRLLVESSERRRDCPLVGELSIPTMYMAISNKMYAT